MVKNTCFEKYLFTHARIFLLLCVFLSITAARPLLTTSSIGNSKDSGSQPTGSSGYKLRGWGTGFSGNTDNFLFVYGNPSGNFDIRVECTQISDVRNKTEAGLMVRLDTTTGTPFCALVLLKGHGTVIRYRTSVGEEVRTITVSPNVYDQLRIKRVGTGFEFYYKYITEGIWIHFPTTLAFSFPYNVCVGLMHASNTDDAVTFSDFGLIEGLPEEPLHPPSCTPLLFDFTGGLPLDSLGFRGIQRWALDTGRYIKTTINRDSTGIASIQSPRFDMSLGQDTVTLSWDLMFTGDTTPQLYDYSLFSSEKMTLNDRAKIRGKRIGSAAGIELGITDTITSEIRVGGAVLIKDRSRVIGNVTTAAACSLQTGASVSGTITQYATVSFPVIPVRTVDTGTANVTVNPNDSIDLLPGLYRKLLAYGNAKIRLRPGNYSFAKFIVEPQVRLYLCNDSSNRIDINVYDSLMLGDRVVMKLSDTATSRNVTIYSRQSRVINFGADLQLCGNFLLPNAEAHIASRSVTINGGLYARKISFEPDVSVIINSRALQNNAFTATFFSTDTIDPVYSLTILTHRGLDQDTITDFFIKRGSSIISSYSSKIPTKLNRWLNFEFLISPSGSASRLRLLYNCGNGQVVMMDTVPFNISSLSSLGFEYRKKDLVWNIGAGLDNISLSCITDSCEHLILVRNPSDTTVFEDATVNFSCVVDPGSSVPVYQWFRDGASVPWTNSPHYSLHGVNISDNGSVFHCRITGPCTTEVITIDAVLNVRECLPPRIIDQPDSITVMQGESIDFSVHADGAELRYQWKRNDDSITGANSPTYTLDDVKSYNNQDQFRVVVTNGCGKWSLSEPALLTVSDVEPCKITRQPFGDTIMKNDFYQTEMQTVCSNGTFQWYKNGLPIGTATGRKLIFGPADTSDNGAEFFCIVNNGIVSDTSDIVRLTVRPARDGAGSIAISGELYNGRGKAVGLNGSDVYNFKVMLYTVKTGGKVLYTEELQGIKVSGGEFTVTLGRGITNGGDLQVITSSYKELYAEVYAGQNGNFELAGPRMRLTAVPYAFTSGIKVIYGSGSPVVEPVDAPLGTMYIDHGDLYRAWKLGKTGWVKLEK